MPSLETGRLPWRLGVSLWVPEYPSCSGKGISFTLCDISEIMYGNEIFLNKGHMF